MTILAKTLRKIDKYFPFAQSYLREYSFTYLRHFLTFLLLKNNLTSRQGKQESFILPIFISVSFVIFFCFCFSFSERFLYQFRTCSCGLPLFFYNIFFFIVFLYHSLNDNDFVHVLLIFLCLVYDTFFIIYSYNEKEKTKNFYVL